MSPPDTDTRPTSVWKKPWIFLTAIVAVGAPVLDFTTGAIGVVEKAVEWFYPPSPALVRITRAQEPNGPTCLEFSFERLPSDFTLGKIRFDVLATSGVQSKLRIATKPVYEQDRDCECP